MHLSRRGFLGSAPGACTALGLFGAAASGAATPWDAAENDLWPEFPRQRPEVVREMVGVCHRDIDRARELLDQHPALVNATWDWGFGDWETALGAAAHTGRRAIAELLLERGARLDIFAAAMLGQTDTVKAMIASAPGIQRNPGPHGITLLAHAEAGAEAASETLAYLQRLGDADMRPPTQPFADDLKPMYLGRFSSAELGEGAVEIAVNRNGDLTVSVRGQSPNVLRHAGNHTFFAAGSPAVRFVFSEPAAGAAMQSLTIVDHVPIVKASRMP